MARLGSKVDMGLLQAPGTLDLVRVWPVKVYNGSERPMVRQREETGRRPCYLLWHPGKIPAQARSGVGAASS
jgi:hypothetical protein